MDAPAMLRLEIAASNVPARLYTVKIYRTTDAPSAEHLPMNPNIRTPIAFTLKLCAGRTPYNRIIHVSGYSVGALEDG
jgi:hypothetical protein